MRITLERKYFKDTYTIGNIYYNNEFICNSLEDKNRDINFNGKFDNGEKKVNKETCIPFGPYEITLKFKSPRFSKSAYYDKFCKGYLPRLLNVPSFDGVLIHRGSTAQNTEGCILTGFNKKKGCLVDSQIAFEKLYNILKQASDKGEKIYIDIIKG